MKSPLRDYMRGALDLALRNRAGEKLLDKELLTPINDARDQLTAREAAAADARIEHALQEITELAAAPDPVVLLPDGSNLRQLEADAIGCELVAEYKALRRLRAPQWKTQVLESLEKELADSAAKRAERVRKATAVQQEKAIGTDPTTAALAPTWRGTWQPNISYAVNTLIQDKSALWISERPTASRPGDGDSGWKLAIKSPR